MVKPINLLPQSYREEAKKKMVMPFLLLFCLIGLVCSGLMYIILKDQADVMEENQSKSAATSSTKEKTTQAPTYQDSVSRINALNNITKTELNWNKVFTKLGSITPKDVTLSNIAISDIVSGSNGIAVKMTGDAPSNVSFAEYIDSLNLANSGVSAVKIEGYNFNAANGRVTFTLSMQVATSTLLYASSTKGGTNE